MIVIKYTIRTLIESGIYSGVYVSLQDELCADITYLHVFFTICRAQLLKMSSYLWIENICKMSIHMQQSVSFQTET